MFSLSRILTLLAGAWLYSRFLHKKEQDVSDSAPWRPELEDLEKKISERLGSHEACLAEFQRRVEAAVLSPAPPDLRIEALSAHLSELQPKLEALAAGLAEARDPRVDGLSAEMAEIAARLADLSAPPEAAAAGPVEARDPRVDLLAARIAELDPRIKAVAGTSAEANSHVAALAAVVSGLQPKIEAMIAGMAGLDSRVEAAAGASADANRGVADLTALTAGLQPKIDALCARVGSDPRVDSLVTRVADLSPKVEAASAASAAAASRLAKLEARTEELAPKPDPRLDDLSLRVAALESDAEQRPWKEPLAAIENEVADLRRTVGEHEQKLSTANRVVIAVEELLNAKIEEFEQRLEEQGHSLAALNSSISQSDELLERVLDLVQTPPPEPRESVALGSGGGEIRELQL